MFSIDDRERLRQQLIDQARADPRLVAAAAVGSSARGGDRWSDLDLTFAVAPGIAVETVLTDWTAELETGFDAAVLFDLPVESTIYRVFLLPGALQVDLSFSPAGAFGARGPRFALLFGEAIDLLVPPAPAPARLFGLGVHHALRAHLCIECIERGRLWQAEYWLHEARDEALSLACLRRGLEASHGRGYDRLPADLLQRFAGAFPGDLTAEALRRALNVVTTGLLREAGDISAAERVRPMLADLLASESRSSSGGVECGGVA